VADSLQKASKASEERDKTLEARIDSVRDVLMDEMRAVGDKVDSHEEQIEIRSLSLLSASAGFEGKVYTERLFDIFKFFP